MPDRFIKFNSREDLIANIKKQLETLREYHFKFEILFVDLKKEGYKKPQQKDIEEIQESIK